MAVDGIGDIILAGTFYASRICGCFSLALVLAPAHALPFPLPLASFSAALFHPIPNHPGKHGNDLKEDVESPVKLPPPVQGNGV